MDRALVVVCLAVLALVGVCGLARAADQPAAPPVPAAIPPLAGDSGSGLMVDSYDRGMFCGPFKDTLGSTIQPKVVAHQDGKHGQFLFVDCNVVKGGSVGLWHKVGMDWQGKQDWSQASELTFMAYVSEPMGFQFTIKGANDQKYEATAKVQQARQWTLVRMPLRDWTNIAAGIGAVSDFDVHVQAQGRFQFAVDELRIVGGQATDQSGKPIEKDPKVIFAKTLIPPKERSAKTYVVDAQAGNDANPGTEASPFKTIQKAADVVLPGDTALVRNGTYAEHGEPNQAGVRFRRSGAPDAWIVFKAYPGHRPQVTSPTWGTFRLDEVAYVEINGFDITTTTIQDQPKPEDRRNSGNGIGIGHAHHIRILNNIVHDCGGGGIGSGFSDYLHIEGNTVYRNAFWSVYNCSGISLWEGRDFDTAAGVHNVVRRNISYQNENKGPTPFYGGKLTDGNGIIIDGTTGQGAMLIENNVCYDNGGRGIHVFHGRNVLVRNNTVAWNNRTKDTGMTALRATASENVRFVNNICVGRDGQVFEKDWQTQNVTYEHNLFFNYTKIEEPIGASNIVGQDPLFANAIPGSESAPDFHLKPASPALSAGLAAEMPAADFDGHQPSPDAAVHLGAFGVQP